MDAHVGPSLENRIAEAMSARSAYFKANASTLRARDVRRHLEVELGLPERELDAHKTLVDKLIDRIVLDNEVDSPSPEKTRAQVLRDVCNKATIHVPPSVYTKNRGDDEGVARAMEALLARHSLNERSSPGDIKRVKKRLTIERELDGIDVTNIIPPAPVADDAV